MEGRPDRETDLDETPLPFDKWHPVMKVLWATREDNLVPHNARDVTFHVDDWL